MTTRIRTAAVLGAGTMGAQIAAHFANAGVPVPLLDVTRDAAREGLARARTLKPDPFFTPAAAALVRTGGFDEDLPAIALADWILEAVVERLDVKQALFERVDRHRAPHAIVSSNTSGIPIAAIVAGRSASFRAHALGTHFFNPPRYLRLVEIIRTPDTDPAVEQAVADFADHRLGKGVVPAKDTPNFIANRIGLYGVMQIFQAWTRASDDGYTIEEIDAITGPAIGRPRSATFRTMDLAGIDVLAHVVRNLADSLSRDDDRAVFTLPPIVDALIGRGWVGSKAGQGFYKKDAGGEIVTLDPAAMDYRPAAPVRLPSLDAARAIEDPGARIKALFVEKNQEKNQGNDRVGRFLRETLGPTLVYAARVTPEIAHSIDDVDRAMQWGFGWELGPFETWDAIGIQQVLDACHVTDPPPLVRDALARGAFREKGAGRPYEPVPPAAPGLQLLRSAKERTAVVRRNAGASLIDLSDGVLAVEFHSKMNAIGGDTIQMLQAGVKEASSRFRALVVGNDAPNFSAGANLMLLLLEAQEGNWDEIDLMVRAFQGATMALKYADVPVVVAPAALTLGGGCEVVLHADRVQAAAETYMGLVEVGVGLIPAGGGTKEMLARAMEAAPSTGSGQADPLPIVQRVFETIGFGKVSTSGADALRLGYLRPVDGITMNRERLTADAKAVALARAADYAAPLPRTAIPVGGEGLQAALKLGVHLAWRAGRLSDHDALIGRTLARILSGGDRPHAGTITEQELLDLEREAFLSLCGQRNTLERIGHTLKTGKDAEELTTMFDRGQGPALVVVQGLHGRWEWMKPALIQLARSCRTISYSLCGDIGSEERLAPERGFDNYLHQLDALLDRLELAKVALCGVSFGGFVALRYAATRPERVTSLVLASAPGPGWKPNAQQARWLARPWMSAPAFVLTTPMRVWPEVRAAFPNWPSRMGFFVRQGLRAAGAPMIPSLMAGRISLARQMDFAPDCARITAPTLVLTGEGPLDRVVPVASTRSFCTLIHGAESRVLERTGHLGSLTQPSRFAEVVGHFVHAHNH